MKVHFSALRLGKGDYVTVSSPDGQESYRYDGSMSRSTGSDYTVDGQSGFWAMSVEGDTAVVALHSNRRGGGAAATIDRLWRGYDKVEIGQHNLSTQSVCSTDARRDVMCYRNAGQCSGLQAGGEGPRGEGR